MTISYQGLLTELKNISKGLKGVTGIQYNALFTFKEGTGNIVIDETTGNYNLEGEILRTVKAKLIKRKDGTVESEGGLNYSRVYCEGWLVTPVEYNGRIPNVVDCTFIQNNLSYQGKFYFTDAITTPVTESIDLAIAIGQAIQGYFEMKGDNGL
jgi:hypothetical protein